MSPREAAKQLMQSQRTFTRLEALAIARAFNVALQDERPTWTRLALNIALRMAADKSLTFRLPAAMIAPVDDVTLR